MMKYENQIKPDIKMMGYDGIWSMMKYESTISLLHKYTSNHAQKSKGYKYTCIQV